MKERKEEKKKKMMMKRREKERKGMDHYGFVTLSMETIFVWILVLDAMMILYGIQWELYG